LRFAAIARYYLVSRARTGHVAAVTIRLHELPSLKVTSIEMANPLVPRLPITSGKELVPNFAVEHADHPIRAPSAAVIELTRAGLLTVG
jgi:hypothetical protein